MVKAKKIYIVEDIAISRMSLETMLIENNYQVSGSAANAEVAWNEIKKMPTDLILLDINLAGEKNGVWLAKQVRKYLNIPIIYLTAYGDQQTLKEVLDTKPNGYLMKPYQETTLLTTINITLTNFENQKVSNTSVIEAQHHNFVFIKDGRKIIKINVNEIYYVKSEGNYIEITLEEKIHVVRDKLLEFKKELPSSLFFQSHQRYLINIDKISVLKKDVVIIKNHEILLSFKYKRVIEEAISNF
ncbi:MAG: DNA-binding LytR/AlgR family response regulator [Patiriisocius sp.]|jgi:DNA-binding LytR/AlgR family response regulator